MVSVQTSPRPPAGCGIDTTGSDLGPGLHTLHRAPLTHCDSGYSRADRALFHRVSSLTIFSVMHIVCNTAQGFSRRHTVRAHRAATGRRSPLLCAQVCGTSRSAADFLAAVHADAGDGGTQRVRPPRMVRAAKPSQGGALSRWLNHRATKLSTCDRSVCSVQKFHDGPKGRRRAS